MEYNQVFTCLPLGESCPLSQLFFDYDYADEQTAQNITVFLEGEQR